MGVEGGRAGHEDLVAREGFEDATEVKDVGLDATEGCSDEFTVAYGAGGSDEVDCVGEVSIAGDILEDGGKKGATEADVSFCSIMMLSAADQYSAVHFDNFLYRFMTGNEVERTLHSRSRQQNRDVVHNLNFIIVKVNADHLIGYSMILQDPHYSITNTQNLSVCQSACLGWFKP